MFDFFDTIIEYITMAWEFFLNIISSTFELIKAIASAMVLPPTLLMHFGGVLGACILSVAAFSVVKMILGRNNT